MSGTRPRDGEAPCHPQRSEESDCAFPERPAYADDLYCPECGYSLRGLTSARCPECGLRLDFIESEASLIPWERRRELGRVRAYWQTVLLVMFRTKVFCRAVYRPVGYRDAQVFRWVSILHMYIPALLALGVVHLLYPNLLPLAADETGWWFVVFVCVCVLLALLALTGLPSYFFPPSFLTVDQQNRAVALSYYGCAALALMPLPVVGVCTAVMASRVDSKLAALLGLAALFILILVLTAVLMPRPFAWRARIHPKLCLVLVPSVVIGLCAGGIAMGEPPREIAPFLGVSSAVAPLGLILLYWFDLVAIARRTLRRPLTTLRVAVLVPLLWIVGGGLALVGLPAVAYFVAVVFYSLRSSGLGGW